MLAKSSLGNHGDVIPSQVGVGEIGLEQIFEQRCSGKLTRHAFALEVGDGPDSRTGFGE